MKYDFYKLLQYYEFDSLGRIIGRNMEFSRSEAGIARDFGVSARTLGRWKIRMQREASSLDRLNDEQMVDLARAVYYFNGVSIHSLLIEYGKLSDEAKQESLSALMRNAFKGFS